MSFDYLILTLSLSSLSLSPLSLSLSDIIIVVLYIFDCYMSSTDIYFLILICIAETYFLIANWLKLPEKYQHCIFLTFTILG